MKKALLFFICSMVLLTLMHCKKPEHTNPCKDKASTSADFIIEQQVGDRWFEGDTVISGQFSFVRFTAKQDADSYTWKIGTETITTKTFQKTWLPQNTVIPVMLIVKRKPDSNCFPDDDGIDTVRKLMYVWPDAYGSNPADTPDDTSQSPYLPIYGTYYGESTFEPGIKKFVTLMDTVWTDEFGQPTRIGLIRGIPYKSITTENHRVGTNGIYKYVEALGVTQLYINNKVDYGMPGHIILPKMQGYAWLDRNNWNKITIEYNFSDTVTKQWKADYFTGTRVW